MVQLVLNEFTEETSPAITGGSPADIANFPFQLSMRILGTFECGASIISPQWALTAAHCFKENYNIEAHLVSYFEACGSYVLDLNQFF